MISNRKNAKRIRIYSLLVTIITLSFLSTTGFAEGSMQQFQREFLLGGNLRGTILLVGWSKDAADVEKLFDIVVAKANESYARLDYQNTAGDVAQLSASAGQGPKKVSDDVFAAFEAAQKVSDWTGGLFDIAYGGEGGWRDIKLNKGASTVELAKSGMKIRFDQIMSGFLAEYIARLIYTANMQNAIVKVGNVFRGLGSGLNGPWKIQVQDDSGTFAHHALNLTVANTGVATVSASQFRASPPIDPRSKQPVSAPCRGVVALSNDAALAEGLAYAVFIAGPAEGQKILSKFAKGLIVDSAGKFIRTAGF